MMEKNYDAMFRDFYENFKNPSPEQTVYIGRIESIKPLKIRTNDLVLYANNLMILDNLKRKIKSINKVTASEGSITHNLNDNFKVNDFVMILRQKNVQSKNIDDLFILVDKVVKLDE